MYMNVLIWMALAVLFFTSVRNFFKINRLEDRLLSLRKDNNESIRALQANLRELNHPAKFKISQKVVTKRGDVGVIIDTWVVNKGSIFLKFYVREYTVMFDGGSKVTISEDDLQPYQNRKK